MFVCLALEIRCTKEIYRRFHWAIPSYLDTVLNVWFVHFDNLQVEMFLHPNNLHLEMKGYTKMWKNIPLDLGFSNWLNRLKM
jgi:hypothetical protein